MSSPTQNPALRQESIAQSLRTQSIGKPLVLLQQTDSTNTVAFELADQGTPHGTVVLSEQQCAGRGRHGRSWFSPPGKNLYGSILLRDQAGQEPRHQHISLLPLIVGVAIAQTIQHMLPLSPRLKWPNDILLHQRKVAGVLCEQRRTFSHHACLVIGFGLNVNMEVADFPQELRGQATSLAMELGQPMDRNVLVAQLLENIETCWTLYQQKPFAPNLDPYRGLCSTLGAFVRVETSPGVMVEGRVLTIDDEGSLHLQRQGTSVTTPPLIIRSGEVFHIRAHDD